MWGIIKKVINSNLAKPLDVLFGELYNAHRNDIVNTFNKANEANGNAWNAIQKGQEIVNMLNDTGGKRYTIVRPGEVNHYNRRFDYSGSGGCLRTISYSIFRSSSYDHYLQIWIDGTEHKINWDNYIGVMNERLVGTDRTGQPYYTCDINLEFKHSITIYYHGNYNNWKAMFLIQTER